MHRRDILKSLGVVLTAGVSSSQVQASTQDTMGAVTAGREIAAQRQADGLPLNDVLLAWAYPGKIRFALWDGGPIEAAKAILSGWPLFVPVEGRLLGGALGCSHPQVYDLIVAHLPA